MEAVIKSYAKATNLESDLAGDDGPTILEDVSEKKEAEKEAAKQPEPPKEEAKVEVKPKKQPHMALA